MYRFFLLNSKILIDFPERDVLEPTVPDLQLEVRYVGERELGRKGVKFCFEYLNRRKILKELSSVLLAYSVSKIILIICVIGMGIGKLAINDVASLSPLVYGLQTAYDQPFIEEL